MITLQPITEENFLAAASLRVKPEQTIFVQSASLILARAYALRNQRAICWAIFNDSDMVGIALIHDMMEEPVCYHLCELMIDEAWQGRGYAQEALKQILAHCCREARFPRVELCVKKENYAAIHIYEKMGFRDSGYQDPATPDCLCMVYNILQISKTCRDDLRNVQRLWATPEVMKFVGFPEGLHETMEYLEEQWLPWVQNPPLRQHYSVYHGMDYCGEAFYNVDEMGYACMDIKLIPEARGKGIASFALSHALDQAFLTGGAKAAWVDPNPENKSALKLYERLGFVTKSRPAHMEDPGCPYIYMEVNPDGWYEKQGICYRDILLRDFRESDIEDEIRWNTVETAWMDWDGPDLGSDEPFDEEKCRRECLEQLKKEKAGIKRTFEIDTTDGCHIGTVSCYPTGTDFQHISWKNAQDNGEFWYTLGIVICESTLWCKGYGTQALTAFCKYFINQGISNIRLQTWSGNVRMIRCAEKICFVEVNRITGNRHIRGGVYDGLTFQLDLDRFHKYLSENP